ncbi:HD domain-containing protein [Allocoprobacillus halotolerans]|uniref:HD domain-containing protein n=1 Tax=Allocoprobacillus halotolerans TaxID=2944914 RepID=A0ABY5I3R7_9FIRM|nr:HD domain-containing protein [Allocoprobacillus halotolerans]UTY39725.1 HD domain-containing protein [Allocoprobacillus halotolerans]
MTFKENFQLTTIELNEKRVLRDAIHDYIHVDHLLIWYLINSKEVQRLRRIKQLGGTYQVFQSAEHSRFTHSLGVYQVVRKMLETECLDECLSDYDKLCVMCAGLLHDIGHGPFSHSFEGVFDYDHEDITIRMILEESEVHDILYDFYEELPQDVASIIAHTHPNRILIQMVSSQLDADRMDYLLRDSYMTGTTYGQFDMSRILRTMRVIDGNLVFKESGVQAIENYILARYHMYWQVYYHPTARSYEHLLQSIFQRVKDLYAKGYVFQTKLHYLMPMLEHRLTVQDFVNLDEAVVLYYFKEFTHEKDFILSDLASRFLNRHLFKYTQLKSQEDLNLIRKIAQKNGYHPDYYIVSDNQKQIPYLHYGESGELSEIEILDNEGCLSPLPMKSEIVSAILNSKRFKSDQKIFFPKEIKDELSIFL